MNVRDYQTISALYYDLAKAVRRSARAAMISEKANGPRHIKTMRLRHRAEAFAQALLAARDERKEKRGWR
jgi:hypothetical protein